MSDPTALIGRCTIQRANGEFCDSTALDGLPYPVCGHHAFKLLRHMIAMVEAERPGTDSILRVKAALDWNERAVTPRQSRVPAEGVVYYLRVGEMIKIGWTSDLVSRLRSYPPDAELLATEPGAMLTERQRLEQFAHHLTARLEWFAPGADLLAHIESLEDYRAA